MEEGWTLVVRKQKPRKPPVDYTDIDYKPVRNYKPIKQEPKFQYKRTDEVRYLEVTFEFRRAMEKARVNKKLTRGQLAALVNEKESVIAGCETGEIHPSNELIRKLNNVLGPLPKLKKKLSKKDE